MKTKINLLLFIPLFVAIIGCTNNRSANDLLNDPEEQDEVLTTIANDPTLMTKLHDKMDVGSDMGNSPMMRSCMAMMDSPEMMNMMMDNMMMRCENDSTIGMMMCDKMMNSKNMRSMMQDRMQKDMNMGKDNK